MLKIGDFSKLSRISIRMLRHYDEIGLLKPKTTDHFTSYRYYSEDQLLIAGRITALKEMGFRLSTIGEILNNYENSEELAKFLKIKQSEVQAEIEEASRRLLLLDTTMKRLRKDELAMTYNVTRKTLPERYVASVRDVIPVYNKEGELWQIMMKETATMDLQMAEHCLNLSIYHDKAYKEKNVDVEIQATVKGTYEDTEHVMFKTVPTIEIASAIFKGSYERITEVNHAVANWVNDNNYEFHGAMFNIYHVSPNETKNTEEFVTEVCYPIKKK